VDRNGLVGLAALSPPYNYSRSGTWLLRCSSNPIYHLRLNTKMVGSAWCVAKFSGRRTPPWHGHLARVEFHGLEARATRLPENLATHHACVSPPLVIRFVNLVIYCTI